MGNYSQLLGRATLTLGFDSPLLWFSDAVLCCWGDKVATQVDIFNDTNECSQDP